ncbi:vacuolar-type H+-ATPase subunit I/STV1 [Cytobacillus eiseniae]|uniref:Vacuolar-type H+-ATPase subunit I/STV1 n=1 Tax=Cytobacillus eiseniae TaxID=762947 RepID=A0ABS4RAU0_9BACI|nr:RsfA family transcriptional regulator [Cytobacillus eiseniae]MBP2240018.1 vacuolar-type H+-ATPase subunit I/STV1 [Cytobacillus eiseniae]
MSSTRQDAWTHDEDLLLAEYVLRYIREGGTQLQAFDEVGKQLTRTAAACGFRWNSYVRKQYKSGIELAKRQRKERKQNQQLESIENQEPNEQEQNSFVEEGSVVEGEQKGTEIEFSVIVEYLQDLFEKAENAGLQSEEIKKYEESIKKLENQLYYLASENEKLLKDLNSVQKDYKALLTIMERARKMVELKEADSEQKV